jgi:YD repeat-containing protein
MTKVSSGVENYLLFTQLDIHLGPDLKESIEYDHTAGLAVKAATDLSGNVTAFEYKDVGPAFQAQTHENGFKVVAPLGLFKHFNDPTAKINAAGGKTEYAYDAATRVMKSVKDPLGRRTEYAISPTGLRTDERVYDTNNQLVSKTDYYYANATFPSFMTRKVVRRLPSDPTWVVDMATSYTPDSKGRVATETVEATGAVTRRYYDANGNLTSTIDPLGRTTEFQHDARGRITRVTHAAGTAVQSQIATTYDRQGNKVAEVDARGTATFYTYDALNRLTSTTIDLNGNGYPDGRNHDIVTSTEYNAFGQPARVIDPVGTITDYAYDGLGRLSETRVAVGTQQEALTEYFYEARTPASGPDRRAAA